MKSGDSSQIVLSGFGIFLSKKSERLIVKKNTKVVYEFPFFRLNEVIMASRGISLSSDLIEELCERGIRLNFLNNNGKPYAMLSSPMLSATVISRREQIIAFTDTRGLQFSKAIVEGKIRNQERLLRYFGKYIKTVDSARFDRIEEITDVIRKMSRQVEGIHGQSIEDARGRLMAIEGASGRLYWDGVKEIIGNRIEFFGRETRGAIDAVNSLLNYGYGILYSHVWGAVINAGLEPFAGFLHVDRPGKPSLVLDLVEEFRQPIIDRIVIAHINLGESIEIRNGLLEAETRKLIGNKIIERLESQETLDGKKYKIRSIIQMQARNLAAFLNGKREYKTFRFKW
ncbi:MAG: CRISPR-associated endonuclease Cas1 [Nitrospirae bacterium GWB2_47_37]|nr:MAG: CRISPR-associated endonuclease Cas1 [Nitrospirae bacterium GWA2_46_11]OGW25747.1 MAG: CRISPR-associated endonuclease Cas1 [Nitrospirae bacterium GWB2_47_37]